MIDQLKNHVDLLFSGVDGAEDMKEEILQNTIERIEIGHFSYKTRPGQAITILWKMG